MRPAFVLTVLVGCVLVTGVARADVINATYELWAQSEQGLTPQSYTRLTGETTLPRDLTLEHTDGAAFCSTTYSLDHDGFGFSTTQGWPAQIGYGGFAETRLQVQFQVSQVTLFSSKGYYSAVDLSGAYLGMQVEFYGYPSEEPFGDIFVISQAHVGVPDPSLTLGLREGSYHDYWSGSSSGLLVPGYDYYLSVFYATSTQGGITTIDVVSASGWFSFDLTPSPEPVTVALVGLGMAGMGWRTRKRFVRTDRRSRT
jgi:hypothetical protein